VVVGAGPNRDRVVDRVDAREGHRELSRSVQPFEDLLGAEVAQVEEDVAVDATTLVDLGLLRAGDDVARRELHRVGRVVHEETLAFGVEQVGAFAAATLGDEHTRRRERRRMELHHLHVLQRHADTQRLRHAVARARVRVRRADIQPAGAPGAEDHGLCPERDEPAVHEVPADDALATAVVDDELPGEPLVVHEQVALHDLLVEHLEQHVARDIGRIRGTRLAGSAEGPLGNLPVLRAREDGAPVLELIDVARRLVAEHLDRVLVAEVVGALDRVERVLLGIVLGRVAERCVDPSLGRTGVAANRVDLGDDGDVGAHVERLDRGAHTRAAASHDQHVVRRVHDFGRYMNG
jgi:hypothetical protein